MQNILKDKNNIKYIAISVIVVIIIAVGTIFTVKTIDNTQKSADPTYNKEQADINKAKAIKETETYNNVEAKKLLEQAKSQYQAAGDQAGVIDTEAQLYFLNQRM